MKCKQAIEKFEGDLAKAKKFLFENNLATAEKKSDRETKCGMLVYSLEPSSYIGFAEITCETDVVLKNENFLDFGEKIARELANFSVSTNMDKVQVETHFREHNNELWNDNQQLIAKIQENIRVSSISVDRLPENSQKVFGAYMHTSYRENLGKSLTYVVLSFSKDGPLLPKEQNILNNVAEEIAVHVFCKQPEYINKNELPEGELNQILQSIQDSMDEKIRSKPVEILEKIAAGKLSKVLDQRLLMTQLLGDSEDGINVEDFLSQISSNLGFSVFVERFKTVTI